MPKICPNKLKQITESRAPKQIWLARDTPDIIWTSADWSIDEWQFKEKLLWWKWRFCQSIGKKQGLTPMNLLLHVNPEDQKLCSAGMESDTFSLQPPCCQQQTKQILDYYVNKPLCIYLCLPIYSRLKITIHKTNRLLQIFFCKMPAIGFAAVLFIIGTIYWVHNAIIIAIENGRTIGRQMKTKKLQKTTTPAYIIYDSISTLLHEERTKIISYFKLCDKKIQK